MGSWALRVGVAAFGLLASNLAWAEERAQGLARLEWTRAPGAEGCLSDAEIVEDVERALRRRIFTRGPADRVLRAAIAPGPSGWHATIDLSTAGGLELGAREIELDGNDCREASDALVLAISLMADLPQLPAEREAPPRAEPAPPPMRVRASVAPALIVDDRSPIHPGTELALELAPRAFVPVLFDLVLQLQTRSAAREQRYWLAGGTFAIAPCPLSVAGSRFEVLGCIGPQTTLYAARGRGFSEDETAFSSTFGGLVQTRASYAFTDRLRGFLLLSGIATPQRVDLVFGEAGGGKRVLDRTPYIIGVCGLGLTIEL